MFGDCQKDEVSIQSDCARRKQLLAHSYSESNFSSPSFDGESRPPSKLLRGRSESELSPEAKYSSPSSRKFPFGSIWRKEKTPPASLSCTAQAATETQVRNLSVDEIKQRWRCQQIANQQQLAKAQRSSWLGWLLRPRSRSSRRQ